MKAPRQKSPQELADETEFARRRALPNASSRYMTAGRTTTTLLLCLGEDLGSKTEVTTRGKVTSVLYVLPPLRPLRSEVPGPGPFSYVFKQAVDGGIWTSETLTAPDLPAVKRGVLAGFLVGHARWAETIEGGLLFGVDSHGKEMSR